MKLDTWNLVYREILAIPTIQQNYDDDDDDDDDDADDDDDDNNNKYNYNNYNLSTGSPHSP